VPRVIVYAPPAPRGRFWAEEGEAGRGRLKAMMALVGNVYEVLCKLPHGLLGVQEILARVAVALAGCLSCFVEV
jgi:hypothetical protein